MTQLQIHINGNVVQANQGQTILEAARATGVSIPTHCHMDGLAPAGNCRSCVVEVEGERALAAACYRVVSEGMAVQTQSDRVFQAQAMILKLLSEDTSAESNQADQFSRPIEAHDMSHPAIAVNMNACIQCTRCVKACRDIQGNDVIGLAYRGHQAQIVFDMKDSLGASTCVACGECVQACPTGALLPKQGIHNLGVNHSTVNSLCPYCGVGCQVTYHVDGNHIVQADGRQGPANQGRLCVKGRYGFDYAQSKQRLTTPWIRRAGAIKIPQANLTEADLATHFRPATWKEALDLIGQNLTGIQSKHGNQALAGFGSAKCSNEEAYLFQKMVRTGFHNNNVDHCTRLCHASSVTALLEGLGSGAVSNPVRDVEHADVIFLIGANPSVNHPVAATWIKNAVDRGAKLIVADPRRNDLSRYATESLQFKADMDVALLNALMHVILEEGLINQEFINNRTTGFDDFKTNLQSYSPEKMAPLCGIPAPTLRRVARLYASAKASIVFWGMGISQHIHGTDNARCLIALALMTGQIGRPGTGLHPLRGQNNVQGASDAGLIPMMYPDYQRVSETSAHEFFENYWGSSLDPNPGLTVVEIMHAIKAGAVRGMVIMGENPAMSDPDVNHARESLAKLDFLVVQDIFPTETALLADVILPASAFAEKTGTFTNTDRTVQLARQVLVPPGDARQDLWIIQQIAKCIGLNWDNQTVQEVYEEMRACMPSIAGISWQRLQREGAVTYPCHSEDEPGQAIVFQDHFSTPDGKGRFVPCRLTHADELPDPEYPFILITGRQLEHWHTGSMTRRSHILDQLEPEPVALIHPQDLASLAIQAGEMIGLESRRGRIELHARADESMPLGAVFVAFCYFEAAANRLTNPALDPIAKIPELKFCAVKLIKQPPK